MYRESNTVTTLTAAHRSVLVRSARAMSFEESYWTRDSQYRRFDDYRDALDATRRWYGGFLRLVRRDLPAAGRHLDVGCGHGAIVHLLSERGLDSHGIDVSTYIVEEAQAYAPSLADRFAVGNIEHGSPFPGPFELVTCLEVLEHLPEPARALENITSVLAPGGRLIATTPNPENRFPLSDPETADPTHISLHPPNWWKDAVIDAGLDVRRATTFWPVPLLWRLHPALSRSIALGAEVAPGTLIVAEQSA
jgi:SAM-dependent methyltransferase